MHEMSMWEFVLNNPQWVAVIASAVFALVTAYIIWRQKCIMAQQVKVMEQQGEKSERHERMQNVLLRLQHEHEWLVGMNAKREAILKTVKKLHINSLAVADRPLTMELDASIWNDFLNLRAELKLQLEILDVAAYSTSKDGWYMKLMAWIDALSKVIGEDFKTTKTQGIPPYATRQALKELEKSQNPVSGIYALQLIIKESTEAFNRKWTAETSESA